MARSAKPKPKVTAKPNPKSKATQTLLDRVATWPIPTDAAGLGRPWQGLAVDERAHALLGCGFPRMLVPVDEPVADLPDLATYNKRYHDERVLPRALGPIKQAIEQTSVHSVPEWEKSMRDPKPLALADAVAKVFKYGSSSLLALELTHPSSAVAEAAVTYLASRPPAAWDGDGDGMSPKEARESGAKGLESHGYATIRQLAHVLWRVPAATSKRLRAELAKLVDRARDPDGELWRAGQALDTIVNGRKAVEAHGRGFGGRLFLSELVYADDDPEWVAAQASSILDAIKPADREQFDIQLAVVGGPKVLAKLRASTGAFQKDQAKRIADELSLCR